jgi:hypothetical protein
MQSFGRLLQMLGLVIVPLALVYYVAGSGTVRDSKLMVGELTILGVGVLFFLIGRTLSGSK